MGDENFNLQSTRGVGLWDNQGMQKNKFNLKSVFEILFKGLHKKWMT